MNIFLIFLSHITCKNLTGHYWGIDKDSIRDCHIHPLNDPEQHESIQPVTIFDIIGKLKNILKN